MLKGIVVAERLLNEDLVFFQPTYNFVNMPKKWTATLSYPVPGAGNMFEFFCLHMRKSEEAVKFNASLFLGITASLAAMRANNFTSEFKQYLHGQFVFYSAATRAYDPLLRIGTRDEIRGHLLPEDDCNIPELFTKIKTHNTNVKRHEWR